MPGEDPQAGRAPIDSQALARELQQALRSTLFSSSRGLTPRRANLLGEQMAQSLSAFCDTPDEAAAQAYGRALAQEGLGTRSLLAMTEALRRSAAQASNPSPHLADAAVAYVNTLLEGYIAGREELVLREQERTLQAFLRASGPREDSPG